MESTAEVGATHIPELFCLVDHFVQVSPNTSTPAKPKPVEGCAAVDAGRLVRLVKVGVQGYMVQGYMERVKS